MARQAKVSLATASKVLNGRSGVSEETRERVRRAMRELGYRPTTTRADVPGSTVTRITVITSEIDSSMYYPEVLQTMLQTADEHDMQVIIRLVGEVDTEDPDAVNAWAQSLLGGGSQGAVFITCNLTEQQIRACEKVGLPLVGIDCYTLLDAGITSISANNFSGGYAAAQHLMSLGHTRIGLIIGSQTSTFARERAYGFRAALLDRGHTLPEEMVFHGHFNFETGALGGDYFLSMDEPPTAIAANCDSAAVGLMDSARKLGVRIPQDLSIVGFDDTKLSQWTTPQLTTVNQPLAEIARMGIRTIRKLIRGEEPDSAHVQLATRLVVRGSTAPIG
ncbi:MAG: LacI family transcriptional regulator [Propionibacteriaceae bacterium]|nr:LacI family transcriptional regulator [Propionibacteriaceae bacterium]